MWDRPYMLIALANCFTILTLGLFTYSAIWLVIHSSKFPIRTIAVQGQLAHVTPQQLEYVVQNALTGNFFTMRVTQLHDAFSKLPWIKHVDVHRRWPDKIEVELKEFQPLARWGNGLLDNEGKRFTAEFDSMLPILEGPDGAEQEMAMTYLRFRKILTPINKQLTHVWLSPRRAWKIALDNDLVIELGRKNIDSRLKLFTKIIYAHILERLKDRPIQYVDLRYPKGAAVKLPDKLR